MYDSFVRDRLPPPELLPEFRFDLPEERYPERLNCAAELLKGGNPESPAVINEQGEWTYAEGCLSIPGLHYEIVRPKVVEVTAIDLEGNEISFEADELFARLLQHEIDHLDGRLMLEHLDEDQLKDAKRAIREMQLERETERPPARTGFRLP